MAAEFAIVNARVRTMDDDAPLATAVAWSGDRVVAVGDSTQVDRSCDRATPPPSPTRQYQPDCHPTSFHQVVEGVDRETQVAPSEIGRAHV